MLKTLFCTLGILMGGIALSTPLVAQPELSEAEQRMEKMALAFEDAAEALAGVNDVADADFVASRVAVDFLMLKDLHATILSMNKETDVRSEYAQTFLKRCTDSRAQALASIQALKKQDCFGSSALPAAISLAGLMKGPLPPHAAYETAMELKTNNMEMVILLLSAVKDTDSAATLAPMVEYAFALGKILEDFVLEHEQTPMDDDSAVYFARRIEDYHVDFANEAERLAAVHFFGNPLLRELLSATPQDTQIAR